MQTMHHAAPFPRLLTRRLPAPLRNPARVRAELPPAVRKASYDPEWVARMIALGEPSIVAWHQLLGMHDNIARLLGRLTVHQWRAAGAPRGLAEPRDALLG